MNARWRIAVLGDGGWGTTLAIHLHRLGHDVRWWSAFAANARQVNRTHRNPQFLPRIRIPQRLHLSGDLAYAVEARSLVVLAVPSQYLRAVARRLAQHAPRRCAMLSVAKGLERSTGHRMSEVIREELGPRRLAVLSGPNIAMEIARGEPASSVVASRDAALARAIQRAVMSDQLRVYTSTDVTGVELGGALKNSIAIGAGILDGLRLGSNAKSALITRGLAEMARLGVAMGARVDTFAGLSGLGDLITTCWSGRNHWLGEQIGKGRALRAVLASTPMVFEGVETSKAAVKLGRRHRVELPIIEQVHAVLFQRRPAREAIRRLMQRAGRAEY